MATTKKTTSILGKMKDAVTGMFSSAPARKSPKRVAAGKKAATTAKVHKVVKATEKAVKKVARKVAVPAKKRAAKKAA
jgi:hypothetical protein